MWGNQLHWSLDLSLTFHTINQDRIDYVAYQPWAFKGSAPHRNSLLFKGLRLVSTPTGTHHVLGHCDRGGGRLRWLLPVSAQKWHVSSAHISLCKTSQMVPPNSKRRLDTVGKSVKYLLSIMVCSHWNIISHLTSCWPLNFSRAGAVSALLCILSTGPYGRLLVVFVVVEWVSFFSPRFAYFIFGSAGSWLLHKFFSSCCVWAPRCSSYCEAGVWGCSSCGSWALGHSLRSCGAGLSCSMGSFQIGGGTRVSCIDRWILYHRATREAPSVLLWQVDPLPLSHQGSPKCPSLTWI